MRTLEGFLLDLQFVHVAASATASGVSFSQIPSALVVSEKATASVMTLQQFSLSWDGRYDSLEQGQRERLD